MRYDELLTQITEKFSGFKLKLRDDEIVAIASIYKPELEDTKQLVALQFVCGAEDTITIFNQFTGSAEESKLPEGQVSVNSTWLIWQLGERIVFIENRRPGVSRAKIEKYIEAFGQRVLEHDQFTFSLHPVASEKFETELEKFSRIREVDVVLKRPNKDWVPAALLAGSASDSDAGTVEIEVRAERGKSLNKNQGIVTQVKEYARKAITALYEVRVFGNIPGIERERQIKLSRNQAEVRTDIPSNASENDIAKSLIDGVQKFDLNHLDPND